MSATLSITGTYSSTINNNTIEQLIWVSSNTFYVSLSGSGSIYKVIDGAAETTIGLGNAPGAFAFDSNHNFLYVSLPAASTIVQVSIESDAVNGTIANVNFINYPIGLAYVASTNILYAAVLNKHAIIKMQFNGGVQPTSIETFYDLGLDAQAGYLAFQGTSLFMTDGLNKLIYTFNDCLTIFLFVFLLDLTFLTIACCTSTVSSSCLISCSISFFSISFSF